MRNVESHTYPCNVCTIVVHSKELLMKHMETHTNVNVREPLQQINCDECDYKAPSVRDLVAHILKNHRNNTETIPCNYCDYKAIDLKSIHDHIEADHHEYAILNHIARNQTNVAEAFETFKDELTNVLNKVIDGHNSIKQELFRSMVLRD